MTTGRQAYRTVQLTIREILESQNGLANLAQAKPKNQRLKMALAKVNRAVVAEIGQQSAYAEAMKSLTEECAKKDKDGGIMLTADGRDVQIQAGKSRQFTAQAKELQSVLVELRVPSITADEMSDLGYDLTVGDVAALTWLFEEQPYELADSTPHQPAAQEESAT